MTVLPAPPGQLLTVAEYAALSEDDQYRFELQQGNLVVSPGARPRHMMAVGELYALLRSQLPHDVRVVPEVDVDLQLAPADQPGWVRNPDLVVVDRSELVRVDAEGGLLRADAVRLVVEIVSPGSRRTDYVIKRGEYADAGIAAYWIIDLDEPVSLAAFHLAGDGRYVESAVVTARFTTSRPYPLSVDLDSLT